VNVRTSIDATSAPARSNRATRHTAILQDASTMFVMDTMLAGRCRQLKTPRLDAYA